MKKLILLTFLTSIPSLSFSCEECLSKLLFIESQIEKDISSDEYIAPNGIIYYQGVQRGLLAAYKIVFENHFFEFNNKIIE